MSLSFFSPAPRPPNERERQRAVGACGIIGSPPDPTLHRILGKAAKLLDARMAGVSIIDRDRMWFAARIGIDMPESSRATSFCGHAILTPDRPLIIADTLQDERFEGNPFVQSEPGLRFYVGVPIFASGFPIGTLCVLDTAPRANVLPLVALGKLATRACQAIADIGGNHLSG